MATVTQYEDAHAEVVFAFAEALRTMRALEDVGDSDDGESLSAAFEVAKKYGWDWEADDDFASWCLKATHQEICTEGLRRALAGVRL
ncbi:MAG TPA: hypothetical protein VLE97_09725 [Gaiellaceae bacterium]|nr:hypothetical protein [Gaiellaceae bacterium]